MQIGNKRSYLFLLIYRVWVGIFLLNWLIGYQCRCWLFELRMIRFHMQILVPYFAKESQYQYFLDITKLQIIAHCCCIQIDEDN